jgi:hypothetical protein
VRQIRAATLRDSWRSPATEAMLGILADVGEGFAGERQRLALAS